MNTNQWETEIQKLMFWRANSWARYESKYAKLMLRVHYDQLLIVSETKILESINMNCKIKGIYKDDVLILLISHTGQELRKIKFQIQNNPAQCIKKLGEHFPVLSHNSIQTKNIQIKYRDIEEVLRHALDNTESTSSAQLPSNYVEFIKLSLMDPAFPQIVTETERLLQEKLLRK